ncbi:hypothetical protein Kpol_1071p14, partial [Vanderwaltozyma polyspora DSM 70294]
NIDLLNLTFNSSLGLITLFKKICNSPTLISSDSYFQSKIKQSGTDSKYNREVDSGKLKVLSELLKSITQISNKEKVVIVSNYTQTLDIIEKMLHSLSLSFTRLDGSTPNRQRDSIVSLFNRSPHVFAFLLSAKSGGVGLNLIGASRLILFDNDWNPAIDLQAMSRIHRDGQKRPCFIYRLVTTGCIDEKILQRQLMKHSLSKKFLNDAENDDNNDHTKDDLFDKEDLKDLFTIQSETISNTHDLICSCEGNGKEMSFEEVDQDISADETFQDLSSFGSWTSAFEAQKMISHAEKLNEKSKTNIIKKCLVGYRHIDPNHSNVVHDDVLSRCLNVIKDDITFAFVKPSNKLEIIL